MESALLISLTVAALFVASFLLGSIPWGVIISRVFYHTDIREHGSGNIGTTNAMRTMGKVGGGAVFLLDFGKGLASGALALAALWFLAPGGGLSPEPGSLTAQIATYDNLVCLAFLGCILGHIFSPWLGFKGGKGVAVAVGCLFVTVGPVWTVVEILAFALVTIATRYVSAGSLTAAVLCPFIAAYLFLFVDFAPLSFALCLAGAVVVIWAHRGNIERLRAGTERRIGDKKKD